MTQPTSQRMIETVWPWKAGSSAQALPAPGRPNAVRGGIQALVMVVLIVTGPAVASLIYPLF